MWVQRGKQKQKFFGKQTIRWGNVWCSGLHIKWQNGNYVFDCPDKFSMIVILRYFPVLFCRQFPFFWYDLVDYSTLSKTYCHEYFLSNAEKYRIKFLWKTAKSLDEFSFERLQIREDFQQNMFVNQYIWKLATLRCSDVGEITKYRSINNQI